MQSHVVEAETTWYANANYHAGRCGTHAPQFEVHKTLNFYPWHRGYLLATEMNMQALLKDDSVSIPYWEWPLDSVGGKVGVPEPFKSAPLLHPRATDQLYLEEVSYRRALDQSDRFVGTMTPGLSPTVQDIGFGGYSLTPGPNSAIEAVPHNSVHNGIGGDCCDMGDLKWSPLDPLFYGHHGNLDRLWESWRTDPARRQTEPWDDHDFGTQVFEYFDVRLPAPQYFPIVMAKDINALGYRYAPIGERPSPAMALVQMTEVSVVPRQGDLGEPVASGSATIRSQGGPAALALGQATHAILTLSGIAVPARLPVTVAVYLTRTSSQEFRPADAVYAGLMAFQADKEPQQVSFALDVSEPLHQLGAVSTVQVVLVALKDRSRPAIQVGSYSIVVR